LLEGLVQSRGKDESGGESEPFNFQRGGFFTITSRALRDDEPGVRSTIQFCPHRAKKSRIPEIRREDF
jgi:hypothetical protein